MAEQLNDRRLAKERRGGGCGSCWTGTLVIPFMRRDIRRMRHAGDPLVRLTRSAVLAFILLMPALAVRPTVTLAQEGDAADEAPADQGDLRTPYTVEIVGVADDDLRAALRTRSRLVELQEQPPATVLGVRRRAREDAERFVELLDSSGYYASSVRFEIDAEVSPAVVTLSVEPGPRYSLQSFEIDYIDREAAAAEGLPKGFAASGLEPGQPAEADAVLSAITEVVTTLKSSGHPYAKATGHTARVDHADRSMSVVAKIDAGPRAPFGAVTFTGVKSVEGDYLRRQVPWTVGDTYDQEQVRTLQRRLLETGLFETVVAEPADALDADGGVPVIVTVTEAEHRSVGFGVNYSSSLGPGATAFWEHRNLFGGDEDLRTELALSAPEQSAEVSYREPDFLLREQDLEASLRIASEDVNAYQRDSAVAFVGVERPFWEHWRIGGGVSGEIAQISNGADDEVAQLLGLPLTAVRDTTDSLLDPRHGTRLNIAVTPYTGVYGDPVTFVRARVEGRAYVPLDDDADTVLAGRLAYGTIVGAGESGVPQDKRFYVGGGGSLRGYGYQMASPMLPGNEPAGGESMVEAALELRVKVTQDIGIAPFVEAGRAYSEATPDLAEELFYGAGLGVRYYSPVGPIRADIAFPINPRRDVDDLFQFYISLGQAF